MVNSTEFAKRLEKIIDFHNLSATAFADKIDFNRSTISHLISGRNKPSLEFVMKVVQTFDDVNLYWLLNGKGTFPSGKDTVAPIEESSANIRSKNSDLKNPENNLLQNDANNLPASFQNYNASEKSIDRIVIFFKDGSFKSYEN